MSDKLTSGAAWKWTGTEDGAPGATPLLAWAARGYWPVGAAYCRTSGVGLDYQRAPAGASVYAEKWAACCEGYMACDVVVSGVFDVITGFLTLC